MKEEKIIELTKEQLGEVAGGAGMKGDKGGNDTEMARCPTAARQTRSPPRTARQ